MHTRYVPRDELPQLLGCWDVVMFPSMTQYETFGIENVEAMAAGLPVVHFGEAGLQDYFVDDNTYGPCVRVHVCSCPCACACACACA